MSEPVDVPILEGVKTPLEFGGPSEELAAFAASLGVNSHPNNSVIVTSYPQGIVSVITARIGRLQLEMLYGPSHWSVPSHRHPGVEVYEFPIAGTPGLRLWGATAYGDPKQMERWARGEEEIPGESYDGGDWHEHFSGKGGGWAIASFQKWDEGLEMAPIATRWEYDLTVPRP